jgi:hypothetical protein
VDDPHYDDLVDGLEEAAQSMMTAARAADKQGFDRACNRAKRLVRN